MKSVLLSPSPPTMRRVRLSCRSRVASASPIKPNLKAISDCKSRSLGRRSKTASIAIASPGGSTIRLRPSRLQATALTSAVRNSSVRRLPGTLPPGIASAARAASLDAVSRSLSQLTRKFATDGTKIRTSASITKAAVSISSLEGRPMPSQARRDALRPPDSARRATEPSGGWAAGCAEGSGAPSLESRGTDFLVKG